MSGKDGGVSVSAKPTEDDAHNAATMTAASRASHALPPEKPEAVWTRTKVILAFWFVIIFLGLPMWWKTTSIYRARLPLQEMIDWADGKVRT